RRRLVPLRARPGLASAQGPGRDGGGDRLRGPARGAGPMKAAARTSEASSERAGRAAGPIHVAGMARAGTSWVAEMLRAAGGFVHLNEPFNHKHPPGGSPGILNAPVPVGYLYVTEANAAPYRAALADTLRFRYRHRAEIGANRSLFDLAKMAKYSTTFALGALTAKRPLLDDPYASLAAEWIAAEFDGQAAVIIRHPAAMVASYRRLGYRA